MKKLLLRFGAIACTSGLAACGTVYDLPDVTDASSAEAKAMFAEERRVSTRRATSSNVAAARFKRVVSRVKPVAISLCRTHSDAEAEKACDLPVLVDTDMPVANAYQTRDAQDRPFVAFTIPMLMQIESDDEMAFILGHEYGHHIADHI